MARNDHSGYPMKWFKDENAARRAYECVICLEVVKDAVQVRDCGHQFCALCIDDILKADPRCPSCRIEISDAMVFADHAARRLIKQLEVNCCNEGCTWTGCLSSLLQGHQNNCNYLIQRNEDNAQKLKVEELEKKHDTLMLKVLLFEQKHEEDITVLRLKYEQDIQGLKLKYEEDIKELKLKHQRDIEDLQLKHMQEKQDIRELQLKHQQENQEIRELQLKHQQEKQDIRELQLKHELEKRDIKDFKLKHEQDIGELKLKIQQAEDLWKRLKEKEKELGEKEKLQKTSLQKNKNRWQRPEEKEKDLSEEDKETAELFRDFLAILNKLTSQNLKSLVEQAMALNIDTPERLEGVIGLLYETAIRQPMFSVAYANMCRCLITMKVTGDEGEDVSFRKLLLSRCQKEFEKGEQALEKNRRLESLSGSKSKDKENGLDEVLEKNRKRMMGNIKFIGELFKLKILSENIMHDCIFKLLRAGDEESLESMCKLLFIIGKDLETDRAKPRIQQYFDQINKIIVTKKTSSRVVFMLRDVVELRDNNWIPLHEEQYNPETVGQTHIRKINEQRFSNQFPVKSKKLTKDRQVQRDSLRPSDHGSTTSMDGVPVPLSPFEINRTKSFEQLGHGNCSGIDNSSQEQDEPLRNLVHHSASANRPHAFMRTASTPSFAGLSESDGPRIKDITGISFQELKAFGQDFRLFKDDAAGEKSEDDRKDGAGKTAPVTQVRKYDREFLLQLRYKPICLQKPAGLPDHEIFLDRPVMPHKGAGSQRGFPPPLFQKKSRFDDDVLCIVQDETSFSKFHVNLPRSTSILDLYKRAADEFGYKQDSFLLVLKHTTVGQNEEVQEMELLNWTKILTLGDVCQPPPKRKHRFFLRRRAMNIVGMNNGGNP